MDSRPNANAARAAAPADTSALNQAFGLAEDAHDRQSVEQALRRSQEFAQSIYDSSSNAIEVLDLDGRLRFINQPGVELFENDSAESVLGLSYDSFYSDENRPLLQGALDAARRGEQARYTVLSPTFRGTPKWWDVAVSPIRGADGHVERILIITADVTETKHAEAAILAANASLAGVLETTMDCVIVIDRDWCITYMNRNVFSVVGAGASPGADIRTVLHDIPMFAALEEAMDNHTSLEFETFSEARGLWLEMHAAGSAAGLTLFFRDVTEQHRARQQIHHQAYHDALTGLPNRSHLRRKLLEIMAGPAEPFALLLLDLDDFKSVNDAFGHPAGDRLLIEIAKLLRQITGGKGTIARLGGDEFALILPQSAYPHGMAEALVQALNRPVDVEGRLVRTGVSIGIAFAPGDAAKPDALFARADMALYEAKGAGGKTIRHFMPEFETRLLAREAIKQDLAMALENEEFALVYQPQYSLCGGHIVGFEALLRWQHPVRGAISPADFIPLAEESGMINAIGDWVLERACLEASHWPEHISVAINLSPIQFRNETLPLRVLTSLFISNLNPKRLKLEVTESVLLHETEQNLRMLEELRTLGARIALDDFGTGYSSLSYLRSFPFDEIKIDRSFTRHIGESVQVEAIIQAVADLGRALKVETTAEGIETSGQQRWLMDAGFSNGQGFLFSRPLPPEQALALAYLDAEHAPLGHPRAVRRQA